MNQKNQSRRNFAKSVAGVIAAAPFFNLFAPTASGRNANDLQDENLRALPDRPPPIVIKSGSFVIKSEERFDRISQEATYFTDSVPIQSVLVNRINDSKHGRAISNAFCDPNGFEIRISLQGFLGKDDFNKNIWTTLPETFDPNVDFTIKGRKFERARANQKRRGNFELVVNFPKRDTDEDPVEIGDKHPNRNYELILLEAVVRNRVGDRVALVESKVFRFGKVELFKNIPNGNPVLICEWTAEANGDEFVISIWNEVRDCRETGQCEGR